VVGLAIAGWDIRERLRQFGPGKRRTFRQWLGAFPSFRPKPVVLGAAAATSGSGALRATLHVSLPADASVERRVEFLQGEYERLSSTVNELTRRSDSLEAAVGTEAKIRKATHDESRRELAHAMTSGLDLAAGGILLILAGLLMSTFSQELYEFYKPMCGQ